ncbi:unnamed protein product [Vitrella brassicaformis CCMP3155]|uniref:Uncharacterized protein n=1 Tax=Vitrella brassicaformis (strain CCMP3155) TaxID=1169540 RepID=A0A0G4EW70_VITBC|nr:unnamed protein product [Vitrella brassicaformis CCMP3155]|eukprot:CEM02493.1 unnamed protein product [Vitrella brassicaformis CCMP3155]
MERQFVTIVQEIQSTDSDAVNIPLADILSYKGTHNGLGYRDVMVRASACLVVLIVRFLISVDHLCLQH